MGHTRGNAKANFEKRAEIPATTIDHLQLHAVVTCNSGQHFEGNIFEV